MRTFCYLKKIKCPIQILWIDKNYHKWSLMVITQLRGYGKKNHHVIGFEVLHSGSIFEYLSLPHGPPFQVINFYCNGLVLNLPYMFGIGCQNDWISFKKKSPMPPNFYFVISETLL
jgi:hypothetical protein